MRPLTKTRSLTAAQQYFALSESPICRGKGSVRMQRLLWDFWAKPTALSREYHLQLTYHYNDIPKLYVLEPDLVLLSGDKPIPHVYEQKPTRLCLYLPGAGEWLPSMFIDKTLVPWSYLWLFYFEDWLATGEWKGGGIHPEIPDGKDKKNSID